jgi:hypothetical protein
MRSKVVAVCLAAALGVVGGVVAGYAIPQQHAEDPLHLGVSLVDLGCSTGHSVLMVGWGSPGSGLASAAARNPGARYLQPARSCDTAWRYQPDGERSPRPDPEYVVYLGPFTTQKACDLRMQASHKGTYVTSLDDGRTDMVPCICYVDVARAPVLRTGMTVGARESIWIRQLQQMMVDASLLPAVTGDYDAATVKAVRAQQATAFPQQSGIVDHSTWTLLARALCQQYR